MNAHTTPAPRVCDCTTECLHPERHPRRLPPEKYPDFQPPAYEELRPTGGPGAFFGLIVLVCATLWLIVQIAKWAGS